jgi:hypothetical protein
MKNFLLLLFVSVTLSSCGWLKNAFHPKLPVSDSSEVTTKTDTTRVDTIYLPSPKIDADTSQIHVICDSLKIQDTIYLPKKGKVGGRISKDVNNYLVVECYEDVDSLHKVIDSLRGFIVKVSHESTTNTIKSKTIVSPPIRVKYIPWWVYLIIGLCVVLVIAVFILTYKAMALRSKTTLISNIPKRE